MDNEKINKMRKIGWRLVMRDNGKEFKATWWRALPADRIQEAVGKGATVDEAIEKALKEIVFSNLYYGIFERDKS